uniref:Uncharacterized protein n=1 Tax=Fusarium oxysporum (strain Fo5176) TaxID=660025 RepID=A0A0D2YGE5_FUSOF
MTGYHGLQIRGPGSDCREALTQFFPVRRIPYDHHSLAIYESGRPEIRMRGGAEMGHKNIRDLRTNSCFDYIGQALRHQVWVIELCSSKGQDILFCLRANGLVDIGFQLRKNSKPDIIHPNVESSVPVVNFCRSPDESVLRGHGLESVAVEVNFEDAITFSGVNRRYLFE